MQIWNININISLKKHREDEGEVKQFFYEMSQCIKGC